MHKQNMTFFQRFWIKTLRRSETILDETATSLVECASHNPSHANLLAIDILAAVGLGVGHVPQRFSKSAE